VNYLIQNTINNNGYEPPVFVARRTNVSVVDVFQTTVRPALDTYGPLADETVNTGPVLASVVP
jgi:hypothetical protein